MKNHPMIRARAVGVSLLSAVALFATGCASIVHNGARSLAVNSQPSGATVTISKFDTGELVHGGSTPMTVALSPKRGFFKGQSYKLRMELAGYQSTEVMIRPALSGWYFGNIVFGGLIGMLIVDPATGAMWNLSPDKIDRTLSSDHAELLKNGDGFIVVMVAETSPTERANMVRIN